jgi:hypothetical protein
MVDYWLAGHLGKFWVRASPRLRGALDDLPAACLAIASGEPVPARLTWRAQEFAVRIWGRFSLLIFLPAFAVIGVGALVRPGQTGRNVAAAIVGVLVSLAIMAAAQMGWTRVRANSTQKYLATSAPDAGNESLPRGAGGRPSPYDFWAVTALTLVILGILFYASTRSPGPPPTP